MPNSSRKSATPDIKTPTRSATNNSSSSSSASSTPTNIRRQPRKRRRIEKDKDNNTQSKSLDATQLGDCNIEDAKEIDRRLRQVARANAISSEDMHKVVRRVVRNEHVLALVTLKAEDEMAREKREAEAERGAIIITETPSVAKLTRAKARELNRTPGISLPSLNESPINEIEALIREDLHSDEEDEEYTFTKEDFSDDDPNTTASDMDSNPCTPQTPLTANEESPAKFTSDGCFKLPPDKNSDDPRIATRTRSKLCLQQTTIEDLQSEFVPPDLEQSDMPEYDMTANDAEWMQFLTDFAKPLNNSFVGDDDDPINDPEYVAAEMVPVDAEELRDVNISKKELTDLVSELFAGLLQAGVSLDSIELETPQKFVEQEQLQLEDPIEQVSRQIDFDAQPDMDMSIASVQPSGMESFQPQLMSTPSFVPVPLAENLMIDSPYTIVNISSEAIGAQLPELIAVPLPGQPSCFQLAKVMPADNSYIYTPATDPPAPLPVETTPAQTKISQPYDTNFSHKYLSVRKHIYAEYAEQFENLRHMKPNPPAPASNVKGFTQEQHDLLQQQLRIHTQMLTQSFLQTYSHPTLYPLAQKPKEMLGELHQRASKDASFNCWNLNEAMELVNKWEHDLNSDEYAEQNQQMMQFINKETQLTEGHTRQVPRLPPRIMDLILDSKVFMYPQYLPRMAFQPKKLQSAAYAPTEYQLIAMGLEKHINAMKTARFKLRKGCDPIRSACKRMTKDLVHGKQARRIYDKVVELHEMESYNPVKYYFEHKRAPPVNQILFGFSGGIVHTPREQFEFLPSAWKYYIEKNWYNHKRIRRTKKELQSLQPPTTTSSSASYLEFVREAVGEEDLLLPDTVGVASTPHGSVTGSACDWEAKPRRKRTKTKTKSIRCAPSTEQNQSLTINVNYVFGGEIGANSISGVTVPFQPNQSYANNVANINRTLDCKNLLAPPPLPPLAEDALPAINLRFDPERGVLANSAVQTPSQTITRTKNPRCPIYKRSHYKPRRCRLARTRPSVRQELQLRCLKLITSYSAYLQQQRDKYSDAKCVQYYYRRFLALELYTQLLVDLRMFCESPNDSLGSPQQQQQQKRQRCEDEARNRKANRQEEMQRHMLQPDSPEEKNRKDATFAYNFYEKVEEALLMANRLEDCHSFNQLLQSFDPSHDKVSDLYLKVEKLLLPDYPELAEVFLNFLLPAEAAELGKFFEYFMITNASNFINKLNLYFCKQPAQIRKIYACLSELAEMPNVSMKKVEARILPLLKGNQFLCDWFVQQFPQAKPPQLILPPAEKTNLHDVMANTTGVFAETIHDVPSEAKSSACQLRYLNGRIFYGSKIMLPAKLSFRAASIYNEQCHEPLSGEQLSCAHGGVRVQGEKLISAAAAVDSDDAAERSEEDEASRALIIDTTTGDDDNSGSSSSVDMCDDVALRAHAMRLNGNYYNSSFHNAASSTPNISQHSAQHHPNAKKTAINFGEMSPRRQSGANLSPLSGLSPLPAAGGLSPQLDKRKSPSKKVRSPQGQSPRPKYNMPPMVVIHEPAVRLPSAASPAIEFAKRLRTLINEEESEEAPEEPEANNKEDIKIIAKTKKEIAEQADEQDEPELSPLPTIKMDLESSVDEDQLVEGQEEVELTPPHAITTQFDSDEDCKLDVVASLANSSQQQDEDNVAPPSPKPIASSTSAATSNAWTREEDKVILIEMKRGARDLEHLIKRMGEMLQNRNEAELRLRHQFLMDFLSKLQGK